MEELVQQLEAKMATVRAQLADAESRAAAAEKKALTDDQIRRLQALLG